MELRVRLEMQGGKRFAAGDSHYASGRTFSSDVLGEVGGC